MKDKRVFICVLACAFVTATNLLLTRNLFLYGKEALKVPGSQFCAQSMLFSAFYIIFFAYVLSRPTYTLAFGAACSLVLKLFWCGLVLSLWGVAFFALQVAVR